MPQAAAQAGDPARWHQEDTTARARFQTLKKEAGAAYQEALAECKKAERATRAACIREARTMFEQMSMNSFELIASRNRGTHENVAKILCRRGHNVSADAAGGVNAE